MKRRLVRLVGPRFIKRWLPKTLWGRSLLIILVPVAMMQFAVGWFFVNTYSRIVADALSEGLVGDIAWITSDYRAASTPEARAVIVERAQKTMGLSVALYEQTPLPLRERPNLFAAQDAPLRRALSEQLDAPYWFDTTRYFPNSVDIRVKMGDGYLRFIANRERAYPVQGLYFIPWMVVATLILTLVAILFIRNQVRAIERLANAAEAFGRGTDDTGFKPHGAREVRQAAEAFLDMKSRIQRHIEQRTSLLASVSHDLRTPLTRLKLELALADPSPRVEAMERDLGEMEHMIDEYLEFARGESGEASQRLALAPLVEDVAAGARRAGADVSVEVDQGLAAQVRPAALKRALSNLVENAAAHARRVQICVERTPGAIEIHVDDDGPGIASADREDALKPFNRLDEARNQNRKGVGLGLSIARDVARAHGGDLTLTNSPLGGLRATVRLPV